MTAPSEPEPEPESVFPGDNVISLEERRRRNRTPLEEMILATEHLVEVISGSTSVDSPEWQAAKARSNAAMERFLASRPELAPTPWIELGEEVIVQGVVISRGGLYVGDELLDMRGEGRDPSLIDPELEARPHPLGRLKFPTPLSYAAMKPWERHAFLEWLAAPRLEAGSPEFWHLLYYGLERRIFEDHPEPDELEALSALDGDFARCPDVSLRRTASRLFTATYCEATRHPRLREPSFESADPAPPLDVTLALGELAKDGLPVPWKWALAWHVAQPGDTTRARFAHVWDRFTTLVERAYAAQWGAGIVLDRERLGDDIVTRYTPLNPGGEHVVYTLRASLPHVGPAGDALRWTAGAVRRAARQVGLYADRSKQSPRPHEELAASYLPPGTHNHFSLESFDLRRRCEEILDSDPPATATVSDLIARCTLFDGADPTDPQTAPDLAQLLSRCGYGVAPDPRYAADAVPAPDDPFVLYRVAIDHPDQVSGALLAALTVTRLMGHVAWSDDHLDPRELVFLGRHAGALDGMALTATERACIEAHVTSIGEGLYRPGPLSDVDDWSAADKRSLARLALAMSTADGRLPEVERRAVEATYRVLGLSEADRDADMVRLLEPVLAGPAANTAILELVARVSAALHGSDDTVAEDPIIRLSGDPAERSAALRDHLRRFEDAGYRVAFATVGSGAAVPVLDQLETGLGEPRPRRELSTARRVARIAGGSGAGTVLIVDGPDDPGAEIAAIAAHITKAGRVVLLTTL